MIQINIASSVCIRSFSGPYFLVFRLNTDQKNIEYVQFSRSVTLTRTAGFIAAAYIITKFFKLNFYLSRRHRRRYFYHKFRKSCLFFCYPFIYLNNKKEAFKRQQFGGFLKSHESACETSDFSVMLEVRRVFCGVYQNCYRILGS